MTTHALQFLLLIYAGVITINILLCLVLWKTQRNALYAWLLVLWLSMVVGFMISGIHAQKQEPYFGIADLINTILVYSGIIALTYKLIEQRPPYHYYVLAALTCIPVYLAGHTLGLDFSFTALLAAIIVNIPLLHTAYIVLRKQQRAINTTSMNLLGIVILAFSCNCFTYPFTRLIPEYPPYGFSIALILLFAISILAPAIIQEVITRQRLTKINTLENERIQANQELLAMTRRHAETLEAKVAERTQELVEANATKDKLFSIISHDLRGPIGSLNIMAHELFHANKALDQTTIKMFRNTIINLYTLTDELLVWATSQQGKLKPNTVIKMPKDLLSTAHADLNHEAKQKQLQLTLGDCCQLPILSDVRLTQIVLRNLIGNALKFTPPNGIIHLSSKKDGDYVRFQVQDTGLGMDDKQLASLFELDSRATSTLGIKGEIGSGFGLMLCKEFIALMGGKIGAESELQQGSIFWFTLPMSQQ